MIEFYVHLKLAIFIETLFSVDNIMLLFAFPVKLWRNILLGYFPMITYVV